MPLRLILMVFSLVLFILAALVEWPRQSPVSGYGHFLGWLGAAAFVAANMV